MAAHSILVLALAPEGRRVLSRDLARESHARLALALHAVVLGDQYLDRGGSARHRRRVQPRPAGAQPGPRLRPDLQRPRLRLERYRGYRAGLARLGSA